MADAVQMKDVGDDEDSIEVIEDDNESAVVLDDDDIEEVDEEEEDESMGEEESDDDDIQFVREVEVIEVDDDEEEEDDSDVDEDDMEEGRRGDEKDEEVMEEGDVVEVGNDKMEVEVKEKVANDDKKDEGDTIEIINDKMKVEAKRDVAVAEDFDVDQVGARFAARGIEVDVVMAVNHLVDVVEAAAQVPIELADHNYCRTDENRVKDAPVEGEETLTRKKEDNIVKAINEGSLRPIKRKRKQEQPNQPVAEIVGRKCNVCSQTVGDGMRHVTFHAGLQSFYECPNCKYKDYEEKNVKNHIARAHKGIGEPINNTNALKIAIYHLWARKCFAKEFDGRLRNMVNISDQQMKCSRCSADVLVDELFLHIINDHSTDVYNIDDAEKVQKRYFPDSVYPMTYNNETRSFQMQFPPTGAEPDPEGDNEDEEGGEGEVDEEESEEDEDEEVLGEKRDDSEVSSPTEK